MKTLYVVALVLFFFWFFSVLREKAGKEREDKIVFAESKFAKCDGCGGYLYYMPADSLGYPDDPGIWTSFCCLGKGCPNYGRTAKIFTSLAAFTPHTPLHWTDERVVVENDPRIKIIR
jgi:hypothetical protein